MGGDRPEVGDEASHIDPVLARNGRNEAKCRFPASRFFDLDLHIVNVTLFAES